MSTQRSEDGLLRLVLVVLAAVVLFPLGMMLVAMPVMGMMGWWGLSGPASLWGLAMMLVWLLALFGLGYLVVRALRSVDGGGGSRDGAIEELRRAYARGEMSTEEFEERRERLENNPPSDGHRLESPGE